MALHIPKAPTKRSSLWDLQAITVAEVLAGKRLDLPMVRADAVKSAATAGGCGQAGALALGRYVRIG